MVLQQHTYLCPICRDNRTEFVQIVKLGREISKDADTGAVTFATDEWETMTRHGKPDIEIRCTVCDHSAAEADFIRAARKDATRIPRGYSRRA